MRPHQTEEAEVARAHGGGVGAPGLRDLPEEGALPRGACLHLVVPPVRTAHPCARLPDLGCDRCLVGERVARAPLGGAAVSLAARLEEGHVAKVVLPQPPRLALGARRVGLRRFALRLERRRRGVEHAPEALGAVGGVAARRQPVEVPHPRDIDGRDETFAALAAALAGHQRQPELKIALDGARQRATKVELVAAPRRRVDEAQKCLVLSEAERRHRRDYGLAHGVGANMYCCGGLLWRPGRARRTPPPSHPRHPPRAPRARGRSSSAFARAPFRGVVGASTFTRIPPGRAARPRNLLRRTIG